MKGIISPNRAILEVINQKINDWMNVNIPNYNAVRWGKITKHPTQNKFILVINEDSRNPFDRLSALEKTRFKTIDKDEWFPRPPKFPGEL